MLKTATVSLTLLSLCSCRPSDPPAEQSPVEKAPAPQPAEQRKPTATDAAPSGAPVVAAVGAPAPAFSLPNLDGETVSLSDFQGKLVVLEWFNPECPYVKAAHTAGSLIDTAKKLGEQDIVYLGINSGGPGRQGHGVVKNQEGKDKFNLTHPILLDEDGKVGKAYGATNTPHIFIINTDGQLAYRGAVDNSPDGEGQSPTDGQLVNYLTQAVGELQAGKPVSVQETKAYGCSVKYAR